MPAAFNEIVSEFRQMLAVVCLILALLQVFFGFRMLKFWITFAGFLAGFLFGVYLAGQLLAGKSWAPIVLGLAIGAGAGFLAYRVYLFGVFFYCGMIAASAVLVIPFPDGSGWQALAVVLCLLAFVAAGVLAVRFSRPVIITVTAVTGSVNAVRYWSLAWPKMAPAGQVRTAALLLLIVFGLAVQFLMTRGLAPKRRKYKK